MKNMATKMFFEKLDKNRKKSQESYANEILHMSYSQYQRYLHGECALCYETYMQIIGKKYVSKNFYTKSFFEQIDEIRKTQKISVKDFALTLGIERTNYYKYLKGTCAISIKKYFVFKKCIEDFSKKKIK